MAVGLPTSHFVGSVPQGGQWTSGVRLSERVNALPLEFVVDPSLPSLGQDPAYPNRDFVVIPRGRFVQLSDTNYTRVRNDAEISVAIGVDPKDPPSFASGSCGNPLGYAAQHIYRNFSGLAAQPPLVCKNELIQLPLTSINEAYCSSINGGTRLMVGEHVMAYYGSATNSTPTHNYKGRFVRWVPRSVYQEDCSATGAVKLTSARYPAFKPTVLFAVTTGNVFITTGAALSYSNTESRWVATFSGRSDIDSVVYEWGARYDQVVGQIAAINPVGTAQGVNSTTNHLPGWLRWVRETAPLDFPPIQPRRPKTSVSNESVTIASDNTGQLAYYPVVTTAAITVTVSGTRYNADGSSTTLDGATLSRADTYAFGGDYTQGAEYDINFLTGEIRFASSLTLTAVTVSYAYETAWANGLSFDAGILGLTDGSNSGYTGLPPDLDVAGVYGVAKIVVF